MMASRKPKIWITVFTGNSGLTHYSYCLARALHEAGQDVTLVTNTNFDFGLMGADFPVIRLFHRTRRYPVDLLRFYSLFLRARPDIVHYQSFLKFPALELLLLKLQRRSNARLVYTSHDWLPHRVRPYHPPVFKAYYRAFDRIIVHTPSGSEFLSVRLGVDSGRITVIPHGNYSIFLIDQGLTAAEARRRLGIPGDRFWFLFFGRIDPHKGLDTALKALALMAAPTGGDAVSPGLIVAGNPEKESMEGYERLIRELGIGGRVRLFPGHVPVQEVQNYLQAADAVVLPYRESSTSGIFHLAMGFGKPVVASAVGGLADSIRDGVTGLLVPPDDPHGLAAAMEKVMYGEETRAALKSGWSLVREEHSWERIAAATIGVYEKALSAVKR